jgi:hypothetical protein
MENKSEIIIALSSAVLFAVLFTALKKMRNKKSEGFDPEQTHLSNNNMQELNNNNESSLNDFWENDINQDNDTLLFRIAYKRI